MVLKDVTVFCWHSGQTERQLCQCFLIGNTKWRAGQKIRIQDVELPFLTVHYWNSWIIWWKPKCNLHLILTVSVLGCHSVSTAGIEHGSLIANKHPNPWRCLPTARICEVNQNADVLTSIWIVFLETHWS